MTTFTSNNNNTFGKVFSKGETFQTKYEYKQGNGCAGYVLLFTLVAILGVIVYFIATHIQYTQRLPVAYKLVMAYVYIL